MKKASIIFLIISLVTSCVRNNSDITQPTVTNGNLVLQVGYQFDNTALLFDTIMFTNAASYKISVTRLQYYLSGFSFKRADGTSLPYAGVFYFDAKDSKFGQITFVNLPAGNYTGLSFNLGLDSSINKTDNLPPTAENNNMVWPVQMGGGYHFMKLEGSFIDTAGTWGYNMHLGTNGNTVNISLPNKAFLISGSTSNIQLKMNVSEWFKNPSTYDFNIDGVYSMGNAPAMLKLKNNGVDVFN